MDSYCLGSKAKIEVILGIYWDNGKENGNCYSIIGYVFILGLN